MRQQGLTTFIQQLIERKDTCNSKVLGDFLQLGSFFPEVAYSQPKIVLSKTLDRKESVTCCEFIAPLGVYVVGIQASRGARFDIFAFQSRPVGVMYPNSEGTPIGA